MNQTGIDDKSPGLPVQDSQATGMLWQVHPDLLCTMNSAGYLKTFNAAWYSTLGRSREDLLSTPVWEMIYQSDLERTREEAAAIAEGKTASRFVNRWRHRDGGIRWISWAAVAKDGIIFCSGRDITEDKRQEAELEARTAERDRLWTLSQDMFARANLAGMMSAVSPGWTTILGWSERELLTRPYATFMHDDDRDVTLAALAQMGDTGLPSRFQNRIATSDGGWKWIEWTVAPELEGQNFIAVGRDLSEVKAREAELAAAQDNLRQSQKMEAVGQLTGGLAHDFNNLLAGISGSLEMMNRRLAQGRLDDIERYISAANQATRRAAALTQRLLAFSRRQTLDPQVVKIDALVDGMLELIYRSVGPEIKVETNHQNGLWSNFVNAGQLENALLNLCINARDAMPNGGIIRIVTENRIIEGAESSKLNLTPGEYVRLTVADTGSGMAPETIAHAFDPFFTTKPTGQGTGLGLSMVYGFAGQSGGAVRIASELGQGTDVLVYLPRHLGEADVPTEDSRTAEAGPVTANKTVLLVDDEPLIRMVAAELLEEHGYNVLEAEDATSALKIIETGQVLDLLITDVGLPNGMNGRQLADAVRSIRAGLKVLFITGYAENAVLNHGTLDEGMRVVTKPFQMDQFEGIVRDMCSVAS